MRKVNIVDLYESLAAAGEHVGAIWTLEQSAELNANLVRFSAGEGVDEHINEEVDVLFVGVRGSGVVEMDGHKHSLRVGTVTLVSKGARRSTRSGSGGFAYLTVHRQRGPLRIGGLPG
jgi:mannose-6-phosphate isomerase-like protein (cupin superfamily)